MRTQIDEESLCRPRFVYSDIGKSENALNPSGATYGTTVI